MTTKLFADSNRAGLREIVEETSGWGDTPATGKTRARRFTQSAMEVKKDTAVSDEIREDRMVSSIVETGASSGGDISWEFSAGNQDADLQRVCMGTWSRPMDFDFYRGKLVSVTGATTVALAGDDYTGYYVAGRRIKLSGFVTPANNTYADVVSAAFASGVTTITISGPVLVAEQGTDFTTVADANDVIIRASTAIRFGTTARTLDSNGGNVFAAAVAAKQLVFGQRIYIEGVGYEAGTVTLLGAIADGTLITINDGVNEFVFEAQNDSDVVSGTDKTFAIVGTPATDAAALAAAINAQRPGNSGDELQVAATAAAGVVTITNLRKEGGAITSSDGVNAAVVDFTGGDTTFGGFYTILTAGPDAIVVDRDLPVQAVGKKVTIKGSILRNPSKSSDIIPQSFSLETGFNDVSQFFLTDGLRAGGFSIDITSGAIIKGSTTTMGSATVRANVSKLENTTAGYIPLDAPSTENVSATANVGALVIDGEEVSTALQAISLKFDGSLRNQQAVGSKFPVGIAAGRLNITGTLNAYFADGGNYDRFINHDTVGLAFPIIDQDANTYWFTIPAFKIMSDPIAPGGTDQDVMEKLDFTAFRDSATKCMVQIDRFSSTDPITTL